MLTTTKKILAAADRGGYAVGAFNTNNLEITKAIIEAAVEAKSPVIIQTSEGAIGYAGLGYLTAIIREAARAPVPVAMHLDHGKDPKTIRAAIRSGYTSVMVDASSLPFGKNVTETKKVVGWAHAKGISVEAEIGAISGVEDLVSVSEREAFFTDPEEAAEFVRLTGCDSLAISVGTAHGAFKSKIKPKLDIGRLAEIDRLVKIPLVLHGASGIPQGLVRRLDRECERLGDCGRLAGAVGIPDTEIRKAIRNGIRKINVDSDLRIAFTVGLRDTILDERSSFDPRRLMRRSGEEIRKTVSAKMLLFGSSGRA
ncbi:class II fructose-bisphosphate aldolase family protein [Candidatus Uhrbacteria bacterium]|nr:class II fructose-bisphosphate aldolase family protein [Candidatus Uhrbacteria bacterium]